MGAGLAPVALRLSVLLLWSLSILCRILQVDLSLVFFWRVVPDVQTVLLLVLHLVVGVVELRAVEMVLHFCGCHFFPVSVRIGDPEPSSARVVACDFASVLLVFVALVAENFEQFGPQWV